MTQHVQKSVFTFMFTFASIILLAGCFVHVGESKANPSIGDGKDYSSVNKSLTISEGRSVGGASSVNGSLTLEDNVTAGEVSSVNGRLRVGDNVTVEELSTVNGRLTAGTNLVVNGEVSTVNGKIELSDPSLVKGDVTTVNGNIELDGVVVERNIETVNASIELNGDTHVQGDIVYNENRSNYSYNRKNPRLTIESGVKVDGDIILEREVDLDIADAETRSKVIEKF
jgi:predicted acyltransferase (DUF342 family)